MFSLKINTFLKSQKMQCRPWYLFFKRSLNPFTLTEEAPKGCKPPPRELKGFPDCLSLSTIMPSKAIAKWKVKLYSRGVNVYILILLQSEKAKKELQVVLCQKTGILFLWQTMSLQHAMNGSFLMWSRAVEMRGFAFVYGTSFGPFENSTCVTNALSWLKLLLLFSAPRSKSCLWQYCTSVKFHLKEVVWGAASHVWFSSAWCWVKLQEWIFQSVIKFHYCSLITTAVTIVWSTKNGHYIPVMAPVVSLHHQLMGSRNQGKAIGMVKCFRDVLSKCVASTSRRNTPSTAVIWIRP